MPSQLMKTIDHYAYKRRWPWFYCYFPPEFAEQAFPKGSRACNRSHRGGVYLTNGETYETIFACVGDHHVCGFDDVPKGEPIYVLREDTEPFWWSATIASVASPALWIWTAFVIVVYMFCLNGTMFEAIDDNADDPVVILSPLVIFTAIAAVNIWFAWYTKINPPKAALVGGVMLALGAKAAHDNAYRKRRDQQEQDMKRLAQMIAQEQASLNKNGRPGPLSYGG